MRKLRELIQDRRVVYIACGVLCVLLLVLTICERQNPEAGVDLMRSILRR